MQAEALPLLPVSTRRAQAFYLTPPCYTHLQSIAGQRAASPDLVHAFRPALAAD